MQILVIYLVRLPLDVHECVRYWRSEFFLALEDDLAHLVPDLVHSHVLDACVTQMRVLETGAGSLKRQQ
jgi:hypothetical protein